MHVHPDKTQGNRSQSVANGVSEKQRSSKPTPPLVDNRPQAIAQRRLQEMANTNNRIHVNSNPPIQRTEADAKRYVTERKLWRKTSTSLINLMATLYLECSPEFDQIYARLIHNLPQQPVQATDGYDPPTVHDVNMALEEEIQTQTYLLEEEPMPPKVKTRVQTWSDQVEEDGLERRAKKKSDGKTKRAKMMNAGGDIFRLYHTKTAPTKNKQEPGDQGKSAFFNRGQAEYFRSSANNVQKDILGITGGTKHINPNKMGDTGFVNKLEGMYATEGGNAKSSLLKNPAKPHNNTPFGLLNYEQFGQGHPGPKLGAEINSFTYNLLEGYGSKVRTYQPNASLGKPKEHLESEQDQYFHEAWYLTDHHFDTPEDYESELFGHYQRIVSGAQEIYKNRVCQIGSKKLTLVRANKGGKSNFFNYPAVIFEINDKKNLTGDVTKIKDDILNKWNAVSPVKMTERQSFGFLYPSISDLEKSIRIWPGQYQIEAFLDTLKKVITLQKAEEDMEVEKRDNIPVDKLPLLQNTLKRSMNLATAALDRVKGPNEKVKVLFNNIASNFGKGLRTLSQWDSWPIEVLFVEAAQIIENINEAVLHLSGEYDQGFAKSSFESAVINHYLKHINGTGYSIDSFYLTHSGQQGASSSMIINEADTAFLKKSVKDRGAVYFETMASKRGVSQIKLVDPAYNFTCEDEVRDFATQTITDAHIYDITNLDPANLIQILSKNPHPRVSLYASFSKHFQFGTDSTNLGFVIHLQKNKGEQKSGKKHLGSYVPKGAVWDRTSQDMPQKEAHIPAVPSELYHHAALLFEVQTGSGSSKKEQGIAGPQQFFMGHQFSDWHESCLLEVINWVDADDQCGIHSLHHLLGTPDSRQELLDAIYRNSMQLSFSTNFILMDANEWLDQDALIEIAHLAGKTLAVYEFNQQYGRWALVAGDADNPAIHIGRVPHASGGGNDHWVPLRRL